MSGDLDTAPRRRVPAAERRQALIDAAVHEFAISGLHGTPVARIARRVGVAQPYVFALFETKRDLFLAALERSYELVGEAFVTAAAGVSRQGSGTDGAQDPRGGSGCEGDALAAMGAAYKGLLASNRDYLMLQHQAYAACGADETIRTCVRSRYAQLVALVAELSGADTEHLDDFFRHGMAFNVAAALGVDDLATDADWVSAEAPVAAAIEDRADRSGRPR